MEEGLVSGLCPRKQPSDCLTIFYGTIKVLVVDRGYHRQSERERGLCQGFKLRKRDCVRQ
jgi:hypothetical protein